MTVPSLMPPAGATGAMELPTPFQSVGARGLNNLTAKTLLVLYPPGSPNFRLRMDEFVQDELAAKAGSEEAFEQAKADFEAAFGKIERSVYSRQEERGIRITLYEAIRHLYNSGNAVTQRLPSGRRKFYRLDKYVVKREKNGDVKEIIIREELSRASLPQYILQMLPQEPLKSPQDESKEDSIELYTRVYRDGSMWRSYQEVVGKIIDGTEGSYSEDLCPWVAHRLFAVDGEDYGRSYVEEYLGDLRSLESLRQSIVEGSAIAAKSLLFVNPGGLTSRQEVAEAANGEVLEGDGKDITAFQFDKNADLQVAKSTHDDIKHSLEQAFLLLTSVQRDAERVTAEEIRTFANELEIGLGGMYSVFAAELQRPIAVGDLAAMQKEGKLPHLPKDAVKPQIVTGMEGLGRQTDLQKLEMLMNGLAERFGPEAVAKYVNVGNYLKRKATALGMDIEGLVRSDEEIAQMDQASAQQQMVEKLGPHVMRAMSDQAKDQQTPQQAS